MKGSQSESLVVAPACCCCPVPASPIVHQWGSAAGGKARWRNLNVHLECSQSSYSIPSACPREGAMYVSGAAGKAELEQVPLLFSFLCVFVLP